MASCDRRNLNDYNDFDATKDIILELESKLDLTYQDQAVLDYHRQRLWQEQEARTNRETFRRYL